MCLSEELYFLSSFWATILVRLAKSQKRETDKLGIPHPINGSFSSPTFTHMIGYCLCSNQTAFLILTSS